MWYVPGLVVPPLPTLRRGRLFVRSTRSEAFWSLFGFALRPGRLLGRPAASAPAASTAAVATSGSPSSGLPAASGVAPSAVLAAAAAPVTPSAQVRTVAQFLGREVGQALVKAVRWVTFNCESRLSWLQAELSGGAGAGVGAPWGAATWGCNIIIRYRYGRS